MGMAKRRRTIPRGRERRHQADRGTRRQRIDRDEATPPLHRRIVIVGGTC